MKKTTAEMTYDDVAASIRGSSNRSARSASRFRGVIRDEVAGKWLAMKGTSKDGFLGLYETEEEAAVAFDFECIKQKGYQAITNYDLRCYDVDNIINKHIIQQHQRQEQAMLELERARISSSRQQQPVKRPMVCRLNIIPRPIVSENLKRKFLDWAVQAARNELAKASSFSFQHGAYSPFSHYRGRALSREAQTSSIVALGHETSSSSQSHDQSSCGEQEIVPYKLLGPYQFSIGTEELLKAQGLGFKHAASSCFKPFKNDSRNKGKEKVIDPSSLSFGPAACVL